MFPGATSLEEVPLRRTKDLPALVCCLRRWDHIPSIARITPPTSKRQKHFPVVYMLPGSMGYSTVCSFGGRRACRPRRVSKVGFPGRQMHAQPFHPFAYCTAEAKVSHHRSCYLYSTHHGMYAGSLPSRGNLCTANGFIVYILPGSKQIHVSRKEI